MKYLFILLLLLLSACDYDDYFYDVDVIPLSTESLLIKESIGDVESVLLDEGYIIFMVGDRYETGIRKIKDVGYFKYELVDVGGAATKVKVLYGENADNMHYLKYTKDDTAAIYNELLKMFKTNSLYYEDVNENMGNY